MLEISCHGSIIDEIVVRPEFFHKLIYGIFFRLSVGAKKSSENDQLIGHFQSSFLISPEQTVKLVK